MKEVQLYFYPMKMSPVYKDYLWGGRKLQSFNKKSDKNVIAESWEVSCNKDGLTKIANGYYKGKTLKEIIEKEKYSFLGDFSDKYDDFPLIIKLIDAEKDLSIQVHPSEENADKYKGEAGKTEFWYIMDCKQDSFIYYGFKRDISKKEFLDHVKEKKICELINKINVKQGEVYYIPAGTIHALGQGVVAAEIQQNSNTTFRIYDYDRKDAQGNLRPLHIDRAKDVLNLKKTIPNEHLKKEFTSFKCDYFKVNKEIVLYRRVFNKDEKTFNVVQFIEGNATIICDNILYSCKKGDTFFIPAKIKNYTISGPCELIITQL